MKIKIKKDDLLDIYTIMTRIRKFEEKAADFYKKALIKGSLHLYIGEEAIAATVCKLLNKDDYISSTHRGHGHIIAKGAKPDKAFAELLGKQTGYCKGRGGSMHISDLDTGILGANGIVGGGIPTAVGAGLSSKILSNKKVSVVFFGDGAANQGTFHESINLAALWQLPVIFVCENNHFGMTVPISESTREEDIYLRARGYGLPGYKIDGNDVIAIYETAYMAIENARNGKGPALLECKTYRWSGHWEGDSCFYREEAELEKWVKKCPIKRLEKILVEEYGIDKAELEKTGLMIDAEINQAADFALNSPYPDPKDLLEDVFYNSNKH